MSDVDLPKSKKKKKAKKSRESRSSKRQRAAREVITSDAVDDETVNKYTFRSHSLPFQDIKSQFAGYEMRYCKYCLLSQQEIDHCVFLSLSFTGDTR